MRKVPVFSPWEASVDGRARACCACVCVWEGGKVGA